MHKIRHDTWIFNVISSVFQKVLRKHPQIAQLDVSDSISDDLDNDDIYLITIQYWNEGNI